MAKNTILTRRAFLRGAAAVGAGAILAACGGAPAAPAASTAVTGAATAVAPAAATVVTEAATAVTGAATAVAATVAPAPTTAPAATAVPTAVESDGGEFHGAFPYQVPPTGHWNSFAPDGIPNGVSIYWDLLEEPLARYKWATNEWIPLLAADQKIVEPDKFVIKLRDAKWSDGSPVTAKDVVATFNIGRVFNWTVFNYVSDVTATDEKTVEFKMSKPSTLVRRFVLTTNIRSAATYGAIADKVAALVKAGKTKDSDEWKAVLKEATEFRPTGLIVSGPYNIDPASITEASLEMTRVPTAWNADKVKFSKIVLYNGETPTVTPLILAGDVDYATHGFPPATEKEYVAQGIRIIRAPTYGGPALYFNHDKAPLNKKEVRQAMAYSIKRDENGAAALGESGVKHKYMVGISDNLVPDWIDKDTLGKLNTYEYDLAAAEKLLTGIGFKKGADGMWTDEAGKKLEYELIVPAEFADWSAAAENVAQQLNAAGFAITVRGVQFQQHGKDVLAGNYVMAISGWGAANPHPSFSYQTPLFTRNYVESTTGKGMNFPLKQKFEGKEIDLQALLVDSAVGLDEAAQKANIAQIARIFNDLLPIVPIWERYGNNPALNVRVTGYPAEGDPIYKNAVYGDNFVVLMIQDGTLTPKA